MTTNDFSHPQRMSPGAFFIIYTKIFMRSIAPLSLVGMFNIISAKSNDKIWLILLLAALCLIVPLAMALISYLPKKFYIKDANLVVKHGLLIRDETIVPLDKVHSLRTEKGLWFRIHGMRGIIFDTLATRQEEIELILDEYEWKRLLAVIDKAAPQPEESTEQPAPFNPTQTVSYPNRNLFLAALCQNHLKGMAVFGTLGGVIIGNLQDLSEEATHTLAYWLESFTDTLLSSPLTLIEFLAVTYAVILLFWLGKILLRYYDTTLTYDKKLLTFSFGLISRASSRFFFDRICTISIKRNFLEKRFGFCTLMLRQALNATAEKADDNMKLYGSDSSEFFLSWWLGNDYAREEDVLAARSGKGVFYRFVALRGVIAIGIAIGLACSELFLLALLPVIYLLMLVPMGILARRHSRIELKPTYCVIHEGALAETANYIKYSDIEVVAIHRSPLTHWTHRAALALSTSGTTFIIRSLREKEAILIREYLLYQSEMPIQRSNS